MRAVKLSTRITDDHTIHLELPKDVQIGPAEVIVLVPELTPSSVPPAAPLDTLADFLAHPRSAPNTLRSKQELDARIQNERDGWE